MRRAVSTLAHALCVLGAGACAVQFSGWRMGSGGFQQMAHAQCNLSAEACALQNQGWRMGSVDKKIAHAH